ncbi:MAG: YdcF family protein [Leptospiraceae bacterium]|nr:YdcF family protein [Leptospiraceae bacterium]
MHDSTVAIVLGAAVYGNKPSPVLSDRLKSALILYKKRKVKKILLSGDNGTRSYNELKPMLNYMLKNKVKKEDIFVDNSGFRTLDTLLRAKYIFQIKDAIIVTQRFHQPRAAFIAEKIGIKVSCFESDTGEYKDDTKNRFREFFARNLAWFDLNLMSDVSYTGKPYPISGDGTETWKLKDIPLQ